MTKTADKIALANAYIDDIEAVKSSLKTKFNIGEDVPFSQYPDKIYPVTADDFVFYKASSSYYDLYQHIKIFRYPVCPALPVMVFGLTNVRTTRDFHKHG